MLQCVKSRKCPASTNGFESLWHNEGAARQDGYEEGKHKKCGFPFCTDLLEGSWRRISKTTNVVAGNGAQKEAKPEELREPQWRRWEARIDVKSRIEQKYIRNFTRVYSHHVSIATPHIHAAKQQPHLCWSAKCGMRTSRWRTKELLTTSASTSNRWVRNFRRLAMSGSVGTWPKIPSTAAGRNRNRSAAQKRAIKIRKTWTENVRASRISKKLQHSGYFTLNQLLERPRKHRLLLFLLFVDYK